jgi:hypothetical protein
VTNTWNEVPAVGAGVHWKAQPMFQPGAVIVKAGLVQLPSDWVGPSNKRAGAVVVVVGDPVVEVVALVVVVTLEPFPLVVVVVAVVPAVDVEVLVEPGGTVVLVELPPGGTVVLVAPAGGGGV